MQRGDALLVRPADLVDQVAGDPHDHQHDDRKTQHQEPDEEATGRAPRFHERGLLFDDHEDERSVRDVRGADDQRHVIRRHRLVHPGRLRIVGDRQIEDLEHVAVPAGRRLEDAFTVDDECIPLAADLEVRQKFVQQRGLHRRAQDVKPLVRQVVPDGDHHVRDVAKAREHVADVRRIPANLFEPLLIAVVDAGEIVRTDVAELAARCIDHPEIDKPRKARLEVSENLADPRTVTELGDAVVLDDEIECSHSLHQRELNRQLGVRHHSRGVEQNLGLGRSLGHPIVDGGHHGEGTNRNQDHQKRGQLPHPAQIERVLLGLDRHPRQCRIPVATPRSGRSTGRDRLAHVRSSPPPPAASADILAFSLAFLRVWLSRSMSTGFWR